MTSRPGVRPRSRVSRVVALLLAAVAVLGFATGCQVKPGAAAFVGDSRISESQVEPYLLASTTTQSETGQLTARRYAITYLVREVLYTDYLRRVGADSSQSAVQNAIEAVTAGQDAQLEQVNQQAAQLGLTPKFVTLLITFAALQKLASDKLGSQDTSTIVAAVNQGAPSVRLSPRYGDWVASAQSVDPASSGPDYLQLTAPTPAA